MKFYFVGRRLIDIWRDEFRYYDPHAFRRDLLAGVTVAAVALPLALAFGVASGATAAAGLITAIVAGVVIAILGGARFQISGPTGAMSAVLIVVAARYGLEGVWMVSLLAGIMIVLMGIFKWGHLINFIPSMVITGFTSGIAVIILLSQIDNLFGLEHMAADNALKQLWIYASSGQTPNLHAVGISVLVITIMMIWPARWRSRFPDSLLALIVAFGVTTILALDVTTIGSIPQSLMLDDRLRLTAIPWHNLSDLIGPAISVALLGAVESLLCGTVIEQQSGAKMDPIQELFAQGVGNMVVPFFGGVPATAAIARSSVALRSGAVTRLTGVIHGLMLLLAALALAPIISQIPLAALGGVLAVTAWRMNDWDAIRDIFRKRFRSEISVLLITLVATVVLDLTQAIMLGLGFSALLFVLQSSNSEVISRPVSKETMKEMGYDLQNEGDRLVVVYIIGPLFFGTAHRFNDVVHKIDKSQDVILSFRTVPLVDTTGVRIILELIEQLKKQDRRVYLSGLIQPVREKLERGGVITLLGEDRIFWSADRAIVAADTYRAQEKAGR